MVTSLAVLALVLLAFASGAVFLQSGLSSSFFVSLLAVAGIGGAMYVFYRKSLVRLSLGADDLRVHTRKGLISIPVREITGVKIKKGRSFKMASSSYGLFGFTGMTQSGGTVLVNDFDSVIEVVTESKSYFLSCNNPEKLERELGKLTLS